MPNQVHPSERISSTPPLRRIQTWGRQVGIFAATLLALTLVIELAGCGGGEVAKDYADRVLVKKSERKLQLLKAGSVLREYRVALSDNPTGHKLQEGDKRTPEGDYVLDWRNPRSNFHRSIHVSYPNSRDQEVARLLGVNPGGMIMIHGQPNYIQSAKVKAEYQGRDWTNGCIAVQDQEMDEIWQLVRDGTPIRIQQ
ncbi:MAG TPA: L,D-transpeptidase family protein [Lamprocystis sp. (in: g-proteobacteria)]|nr:L,D-transpeptidase family protein [Lamprocystis sp. (in: g-proteobacteria)]